MTANRFQGAADDQMHLADGLVPGPTHRSYWVIEDRFAAGAYPGKVGRGDRERVPDAITELLEAGIDCFVNLTEDEPGGGDSHLTRYDGDVSGNAIIDRHPIVDVSIPSVDQMVGILDATDAHLEAGRNIYTHCWGGIGRTGTVIGCWMVRHDLTSPSEAIHKLEEMRVGDRGAGHRRSPETSAQRAFIQTWEVGQ